MQISSNTPPPLKSSSISIREKPKLLITRYRSLLWPASHYLTGLVPPHLPTAQVLFSLVCRPPACNIFSLFSAPLIPPCINPHPCNSFIESYLFNPGSNQGSCIACHVHIPLYLSGFDSGNHFLWQSLSDSPCPVWFPCPFYALSYHHYYGIIILVCNYLFVVLPIQQ